MSLYPGHIKIRNLKKLRDAYGVSDTEIENVLKNESFREALDTWLRYEGIIGYTDKILDMCADLFEAEQGIKRCKKIY
jgi:hypothetical protein